MKKDLKMSNEKRVDLEKLSYKLSLKNNYYYTEWYNNRNKRIKSKNGIEWQKLL